MPVPLDIAAGLSVEALEEIEFWLEGVKLHGAYVMVRTGRGEAGKEQWLLIKMKDEAAERNGAEPTRTEPQSVLSGLWVEDYAASQEKKERQAKGKGKSRRAGSLREPAS